MKSPIQYDQTWDAFKGGSRAAFSAIYHQHAPALFHYGSRISPDKPLVEDSVQDLFVELWNSRKRIARTTSVRFYLFKALRYKIYRNLGHDMEPLEKYMWHLKDLSSEEDSVDLDDPLFPIKRLKDALTKLPTRQREAINLRYYQKFSNEEIAAIMNISYRSACKCIYAGLKNLSESLKTPVMELLIFWSVLGSGSHSALF